MTSAPIESKHNEMDYSLPREVAVCCKCVADSVLEEAVKANSLPGPCEFCGDSKAFCGKFSSVLEAIRSRFTEEWSETSEEFEKELIGGPDYHPDDYADEEPGLSLDELFEYAEYRPKSAKYRKALKRAFGDVEMFWRGMDQTQERDRHLAGWDRFKQIVKHERRFTFWSVEESAEDPYGIFETSAGEMLDEIGKLVNRTNLFRSYPEKSEFWRARVHDADVRLRDRSGLFPPPVHKAIQANRMSPAGVVMFYGAEDLETAIIETADPRADADRRVTYGTFVALRELVLLDLHDLSPLPSYFDSSRQDEWNEVSFLRRFAVEIAEPIKKDGRNHVEYVPTQAFTEFVRFEMKRDKDKRIDGIRYTSSRNGQPCVVLFCTGEECSIGRSTSRPSKKDWLSLVEDSAKSVGVRKEFKRFESSRKVAK